MTGRRVANPATGRNDNFKAGLEKPGVGKNQVWGKTRCGEKPGQSSRGTKSRRAIIGEITVESQAEMGVRSGGDRTPELLADAGESRGTRPGTSKAVYTALNALGA